MYHSESDDGERVEYVFLSKHEARRLAQQAIVDGIAEAGKENPQLPLAEDRPNIYHHIVANPTPHLQWMNLARQLVDSILSRATPENMDELPRVLFGGYDRLTLVQLHQDLASLYPHLRGNMYSYHGANSRGHKEMAPERMAATGAQRVLVVFATNIFARDVLVSDFRTVLVLGTPTSSAAVSHFLGACSRDGTPGEFRQVLYHPKCVPLPSVNERKAQDSSPAGHRRGHGRGVLFKGVQSLGEGLRNFSNATMSHSDDSPATIQALQDQVDQLRSLLEGTDSPTAAEAAAPEALAALAAENAELRARVAKCEYRITTLLRTANEIEERQAAPEALAAAPAAETANLRTENAELRARVAKCEYRITTLLRTVNEIEAQQGPPPTRAAELDSLDAGAPSWVPANQTGVWDAAFETLTQLRATVSHLTIAEAFHAETIMHFAQLAIKAKDLEALKHAAERATLLSAFARAGYEILEQHLQARNLTLEEGVEYDEAMRIVTENKNQKAKDKDAPTAAAARVVGGRRTGGKKGKKAKA
ncbi:hypothetical protein H9P43_004412 [Blastocladiella emersonii ATCC 22665]|nr:hypothetical protein H9P43_004412 [Blastocladiella emersonii ATCC 22665]